MRQEAGEPLGACGVEHLFLSCVFLGVALDRRGLIASLSASCSRQLRASGRNMRGVIIERIRFQFASCIRNLKSGRSIFPHFPIRTTPARPPAPLIQPEKALVRGAEGARVDPLVHGLENRDGRHPGRWSKVAPLHASAYDAQNVVVRVVKSKKSRSTPRVGWQGFLDDETKYVFERF